LRRVARASTWLTVAVALAITVVTPAATPAGGQERRLPPGLDFVRRTLDGQNNNLAHPEWGRAGVAYRRNAPARYTDGIAAPVTGPSPRYVSNRIFNDTSQNLFSENGVSQWGFAWGQFLDHTFGLRSTDGGEDQPLAYSGDDPLESFLNDFGAIAFTRTPAAPGTGETTPRQQINTVDSYIDASAVYGNSPSRLEWLRAAGGPGRRRPV
jgi:hypothetical protein